VSASKHSRLGVVRTQGDGGTIWALVGEGALASARSEHITTSGLEALPLDRQELNTHVESMMSALEQHSAHRAVTPGGASWLYVHHVPVRRLVTQLVRKLMALEAWPPFAEAPGLMTLAPYEGIIGVRQSSSREYRPYTVTWSGLAYILGASAPYNPMQSARLRKLSAHSPEAKPFPDSTSENLPKTQVVALSWSSRHWQSLLPVLEELARDGRRSVLVDLATDPTEQCSAPMADGISLLPVPAEAFTASGGPPNPTLDDKEIEEPEPTVRLGAHSVRLRRVEQLASALLAMAGGCTQPSWQATTMVERWFEGVLDSTRPHTVIVSNDTSPLGALAVHASERRGISTVHLQHGAWTEETAGWPALHSRHIVVMGERDVVLANAWARHPDAEVHVLGQPRFDALAGLRRETQRQYLKKLLATGLGRRPERILVWACQPFGPDRLQAQAELLLDGLEGVEEDWGLVITPHPVQSTDVFDDLLQRNGRTLVAVADRRVGARGCLAGADALASAHSTCGIEAVLLNIPVLEIGLPEERTLRLAEHGIARRCSTAEDIADALTALRTPQPPHTQAAADAVCRWRGNSATEIAQLIVGRASTDAAQFDHTRHDAPGTAPGLPQGEGVPVR
jgi:UDP-N-acetylglucosamine 2-epimerase